MINSLTFPIIVFFPPSIAASSEENSQRNLRIQGNQILLNRVLVPSLSARRISRCLFHPKDNKNLNTIYRSVKAIFPMKTNKFQEKMDRRCNILWNATKETQEKLCPKTGITLVVTTASPIGVLILFSSSPFAGDPNHQLACLVICL